MKKILLALSLLYLAFCGELSCLDKVTPYEASDCIKRKTVTDQTCCYVEYIMLGFPIKSCMERKKGQNVDDMKKTFKKLTRGHSTIEELICD